MSNVVIDRREVIELLSDLVRIPSVNPRMGTGTGEGEIARYLADRLRRLGLAPLVTEVQPGRPNVLAMVPGKPGRPHEPSPPRRSRGEVTSARSGSSGSEPQG